MTNKNIMKKLYDFLKQEEEFFKIYNSITSKGKREYAKDIKKFVEDISLEPYYLSKKYLDIAWLEIGDVLLNLDTMYEDWKYNIRFYV